MARVFITGSSDGLGRMAAQLLIEQGHRAVLHARHEKRARDAMAAVPGADAVLIGDLASITQTRKLSDAVNALGPFDAVIHNAAVGYLEPRRLLTEDGLPHVFAVNTLAPYILTALIRRPRRLVYLSSGIHTNGNPRLDDLKWEKRRWNGTQAYSDSKLHDTILAFAIARRWKDVCSNALDPGWVPTKMGGPAPPTTLTRHTAPRSGSPPATTPPPRSAADTSTTSSRAPPVPPPAIRTSRTACWQPANNSAASPCPAARSRATSDPSP